MTEESDAGGTAHLDLERQAGRLRGILESAADGIICIDAAGLIELCNAAAERMFGYTEAELVGRNVSLLMPDPYQSEHDGYLQSYLHCGEKKIIGIGREVEGRRRDGTVFPADLAVGEAHVGDRVLFTGIIRDMTERRQIQQKIAQHEKLAAVGMLASGVAHEIGNPLASISAVVQTMERKLGDPYAIQKLQLIGTHIERISTIVRNMVSFARPPRMTWSQVSINDVLRDTLEVMAYDRRARGVTMDVQLGDSLPTTYALMDQLGQVFLNLVLNAFDAMHALPVGAPRVLTVTTGLSDTRPNTLTVSIQDTGPGVPEEIAPRIFEPFFTTKEVGHGTGLGLAVSYGIVKDHDADIRLDPTETGARFVVELPVLTAAPTTGSGL